MSDDLIEGFELCIFWDSTEERREAALWVPFFDDKSNICFRDCYEFLVGLYMLEVESSVWDGPREIREPSECEKEEVRRLAEYLSEHSHKGLFELSEWLPQWYYEWF